MEKYIAWYEGRPTYGCDNKYGHCSSDVRYVSNPFQYEMNNVVVNENICEICYQSLLGDI